jgi:hypothetical protein
MKIKTTPTEAHAEDITKKIGTELDAAIDDYESGDQHLRTAVEMINTVIDQESWRELGYDTAVAWFDDNYLGKFGRLLKSERRSLLRHLRRVEDSIYQRAITAAPDAYGDPNGMSSADDAQSESSPDPRHLSDTPRHTSDLEAEPVDPERDAEKILGALSILGDLADTDRRQHVVKVLSNATWLSQHDRHALTREHLETIIETLTSLLDSPLVAELDA